MARRAKRRQSNGLRRRKALCDVTSNHRWLHLNAGAISAQSTLHGVWHRTSLVSIYSSFLLAFSLNLEALVNIEHVDRAVIHRPIDLLTSMLTYCMSMM